MVFYVIIEVLANKQKRQIKINQMSPKSLKSAKTSKKILKITQSGSKKHTKPNASLLLNSITLICSKNYL